MREGSVVANLIYDLWLGSQPAASFDHSPTSCPDKMDGHIICRSRLHCKPIAYTACLYLYVGTDCLHFSSKEDHPRA